MKARKVNNYLKGKHPKTLLEVFSEEENEMPVVAGKRYGKKGAYTKKDREDAAKARKGMKGSKKK
jgi:hypothetical protein